MRKKTTKFSNLKLEMLNSLAACTLGSAKRPNLCSISDPLTLTKKNTRSFQHCVSVCVCVCLCVAARFSRTNPTTHRNTHTFRIFTAVLLFFCVYLFLNISLTRIFLVVYFHQQINSSSHQHQTVTEYAKPTQGISYSHSETTTTTERVHQRDQLDSMLG